MASGSLKQYLNVTYDEKLESQADDIEGTLFKFIPSGKTTCPVQMLLWPSAWLIYP
jgi:hypothetical protein